jgi:hypothetical protein
MAVIMAETQRTRNPNIIIAASYFAVFWFLMGQAFLFTVCPDDAGAADVKALPSLTVSEEYNDNVYLTRYNKLDDYITEVVPAFTIDYKTAFWNWHLDLAYDYRYYAKDTVSGDTTYRINLLNHTELIKNFFFIDLSDKYDRVSNNPARDFTQQSNFVNQTDTNVFTFNPYFIFRSESRFTPILGYMYVNTWYKESSAVSTIDNIGYAEMMTDISSTVTFTTGVRYTQDVNKVQNYDRFDIFAGPKKTYAQGSYVYLLIGETFLQFQYQNGTTKRIIWDGGITHRYSTMVASFHTKSDYIPDPGNILRREDSYVASITKEVPRTSIGVSAGFYDYGDAQTNERTNTNYQLTGTLNHAISPTLMLFLTESISRLEDYLNDTTISLWESGVKLERRVLEDLSLSADYRYTNSYSHDSYQDNYVNNRFSVALSKRF